MISPETIARVRERTDIVALIGENVRLKKQGQRHTGLCPFHKEKTPSFSVNQERGVFHCFGCKESGSAIDYVMKLEGYSFPEAVRALAERVGIEVEESRSPEDKARGDRQRRDKDELYALNHMVAAFFESQLAPGGHPLSALAHRELVRRGLAPGSSAETDAALGAFRVGYAPYGWDSLVSFLRKQEGSPAHAERLGLIVKRSSGSGYYDAFRHRLMFAVVDHAGRVVAFSGRALEEPSETELREAGAVSTAKKGPDQRPAPKYVNSPESPIYVKGETVFGLHQARHAIREHGQAVLVEGNFDVLALHARGLLRVVAPLGTAFTHPQAKLVKRYAAELVVLFDGDAAGKKAAAAVRTPAREAGLHIKVASLPDGADPDDLACKRGIESVERVIGGARGMLEYLIDDTLGVGASWAGPDEALGRVRQVVAYLGEEDDPNLRQMAKTYADEMASRLIVSGRAPSDLLALERLISRGLRVGKGEAQAGLAVQVDRSIQVGRDGKVIGAGGRSRPMAQEVALAAFGAILDFPELLDEEEVQHALGELEGEVALAAGAVREAWDAKKSLQGAELLDLLPKAVHAFAVGRMAAPAFTTPAEARTELLNNAEKLRRRSLMGDKAVKVQELARAQGQGDTNAEDDLLRQLERVARDKRHMS